VINDTYDTCFGKAEGANILMLKVSQKLTDNRVPFTESLR